MKNSLPLPLSSTDPAIKLYRAVAAYLKDRGGKAVVIGGIQIQTCDDGTFYVAVSVTGKLPKFAELGSSKVRRIGEPPQANKRNFTDALRLRRRHGKSTEINAH